jgi:hypothetical protein
MGDDSLLSLIHQKLFGAWDACSRKSLKNPSIAGHQLFGSALCWNQIYILCATLPVVRCKSWHLAALQLFRTKTNSTREHDPLDNTVVLRGGQTLCNRAQL